MEILVKRGWRWGIFGWTQTRKAATAQQAAQIARLWAKPLGWNVPHKPAKIFAQAGVWHVTHHMKWGGHRFVAVERRYED